MTKSQGVVKRVFDLLVASFGVLSLWWVILIAFLLATADTGRSGFFLQERIGRNGRAFKIVKIRTMRDTRVAGTNVTTSTDPRITRLGAKLRRYKIDELPQLFNVAIGDMSFVGPRPDVAGVADCLVGEDRLILSVRPGITGPATLFFRDEEELLSKCDDPEEYNREVVFPAKVKLNLRYIKNYSFAEDLRLIWATVIGMSYEDIFGETRMKDL